MTSKMQHNLSSEDNEQDEEEEEEKGGGGGDEVDWREIEPDLGGGGGGDDDDDDDDLLLRTFNNNSENAHNQSDLNYSHTNNNTSTDMSTMAAAAAAAAAAANSSMANRSGYSREEEEVRPSSMSNAAVHFPSFSLSYDPQQPVDTVRVATRVKELLIEHRIGQRLFAKCFLGISQQRLSDLIVKPRGWSQCDHFRKQMYARMNAWSHSEASIESVRALRQTKLIKSL
jgi:hypothetical protein